MFVERCSSRYFLAVLSGLVLSACSPTASTAVPPVMAAAPPPTVEPPVAAAPVAPLVTGLPDFTGLVERYGPAVVNVKVEPRRVATQSRGPSEFPPGSLAEELERRFGMPIPGVPRGAPQQPTPGVGSGFIVSADGYILTNAHVVRGGSGPAASAATELTVKLTDRREFPATIVGFDVRTDVAVIKIDATDLPTVRIGDPDKLKPGQWVVAIGSPFGMENSVTAGIVSALSRSLPSETFVPFIQTDVAVNPGNSGGPLFNLNGEVVGINSQIYSENGGYMGLSFAIPIDLANDVREQLVRDGRVTRGMIDVNLGQMTAQFADAFGLDRPRGALIESVGKDGPADKVGIKAGDIILSVNGRPVESESSLPRMIASVKPGEKVDLELWSDRKLRKVTVQLVERREPGVVAEVRTAPGRRGGAAEQQQQTVLGLSIRSLTPAERQQLGTDGSLVVEEVSGQAAQDAGLRPGDVVMAVAGAPVRTVAELQAAVKNSGRYVALRVQREGRDRFFAIRVE